ncbi:MAG: hypothetical protein PHN74_03350 [Candidatus Pacebacteria bacterium]|nr:hypothetical protein [Candidatus Paceibacterota bacterium]
MKLLILEDTVHDLLFYRPLTNLTDAEINVLFFSPGKDFKEAQACDSYDTLHGKSLPWIKKCMEKTGADIVDFLKNNPYDFYIADSLEKLSNKFLEEAGIPKDKIAYLSSTSSYRRLMQNYGYRAYRKADMEKLIKECLPLNALHKSE